MKPYIVASHFDSDVGWSVEEFDDLTKASAHAKELREMQGSSVLVALLIEESPAKTIGGSNG